jgi:hypothetical protein
MLTATSVSKKTVGTGKRSVAVHNAHLHHQPSMQHQLKQYPWQFIAKRWICLTRRVRSDHVLLTTMYGGASLARTYRTLLDDRA